MGSSVLLEIHFKININIQNEKWAKVLWSVLWLSRDSKSQRQELIADQRL